MLKYRVINIYRYKTHEMAEDVARFANEYDAIAYVQRRVEISKSMATGDIDFSQEWIVKSGRSTLYTSGIYS